MERRARVDKHARTTRTLLPPIPLNNYPPGSASHPAIPAGAGSNGVDWPACPVAQPEAAVRSQGQHLKVNNRPGLLAAAALAARSVALQR